MIFDGARTFTYSHENLLLGASSGVTLGYDASLRLERVASGGAATRFLYDGADIVAEYDQAGWLVRRHVHGLADDEPLVSYDGAGTGARRWLHADERGSIVATTDLAGTVTAINRFDEYGDNAGLERRFQFTGQAWIPEPGLSYCTVRFYRDRSCSFWMARPPCGRRD